MPKDFTLYNLLSRSDEPSALLYKEVTNAFIKEPEQISRLMAKEGLDEILVYLSTRSHRLVRILDASHNFQVHQVRSPADRRTANRIAKSIALFLLESLKTPKNEGPADNDEIHSVYTRVWGFQNSSPSLVTLYQHVSQLPHHLRCEILP